MQWYRAIDGVMERGRVYSHSEIKDNLKTMRQDLSDSTYDWALGNLVRDGQITRLGYDAYSLPTGSPREEYHPAYSEIASNLIQQITEQYPHMLYTVFETVLLNEFLNHLIAQNTIYLQVEKESGIYIFRHLQEIGCQNVMFRPSRKELDLYWSKDAVIVTDMISEAPLSADNPHEITLEKMLVDVCADRLISTTISRSEMPDIVEQAQERYRLDHARLLRYARRRNHGTQMQQYLEGDT